MVVLAARRRGRGREEGERSERRGVKDDEGVGGSSCLLFKALRVQRRRRRGAGGERRGARFVLVLKSGTLSLKPWVSPHFDSPAPCRFVYIYKTVGPKALALLLNPASSSSCASTRTRIHPARSALFPLQAPASCVLLRPSSPSPLSPFLVGRSLSAAFNKVAATLLFSSLALPAWLLAFVGSVVV